MEKKCKKAEQLKMPIGTASNRLKKEIIFSLIQKLNEDNCFQCGGKIESSNDLSIEHKIPYLDSDNPIELFFDLNNIAFSHLECNIRAKRHTVVSVCGTLGKYKLGCRCQPCTNANAEYGKVWMRNKRAL